MTLRRLLPALLVGLACLAPGLAAADRGDDRQRYHSEWDHRRWQPDWQHPGWQYPGWRHPGWDSPSWWWRGQPGPDWRHGWRDQRGWAPGYGPHVKRSLLPRKEIVRALKRHGYRDFGKIRHDGPVYKVPARDWRGRKVWLIVDPYTGWLLHRYSR